MFVCLFDLCCFLGPRICQDQSHVNYVKRSLKMWPWCVRIWCHVCIWNGKSKSDSIQTNSMMPDHHQNKTNSWLLNWYCECAIRNTYQLKFCLETTHLNCLFYDLCQNLVKTYFQTTLMWFIFAIQCNQMQFHPK